MFMGHFAPIFAIIESKYNNRGEFEWIEPKEGETKTQRKW
jgi:hypothetical protein